VFTGEGRRAAVFLSAALLVLGSLGACSKPAAPPDAKRASVPSSTPAKSATTIHGSGYQFATPVGWRENTAHMKTLETQTDSAATNGLLGLREDVLVVASPSVMKLSRIGPAMFGLLKRTDEDVQLQPNVTLGGLPAVNFTSFRHVPGVRDLEVRSYFVPKDGDMFFVEIFADTRIPADQRQADRDSIFMSWAWTDVKGA
jgi:hypothetical protein